MTHRYQLEGLGNDEQLAALSALVKADNALTAELLAHLGELDERRIFLELGFPSLFAYCTLVLGFCESTAGRRIAGARVCRAFPEVLSGVANGEWSLSALCALRPHLNRQNATELFAASKHKSVRQVEELLAARFPRPDVRDSIRRLPARPATNALAPGVESATNETLPSMSPPAPPTTSLPTPAVATAARLGGPQQRLEPLSAERFGVHFTADTAFRELLDEVRALASHRQASDDLMSLLKAALEAYRRELEKERFALGRTRRATRTSAQSETRRRRLRVPAAAAREVYERDSRQCTFVASDGRRCGARAFLQFDHIRPWALGGQDTAENLRLSCRAHNQLHAREYFGWTRTQTATAKRDAADQDLNANGNR